MTMNMVLNLLPLLPITALQVPPLSDLCPEFIKPHSMGLEVSLVQQPWQDVV